MWELIRFVFVLLVMVGTVYGIVKFVVWTGVGRPDPNAVVDTTPTRHCMTCGEDSPAPQGAQRGNKTLEIVLWLFMLWPIALVYSVWRRIGTGAKPVCPACNATTLVPIASPAALAHKRQLAATS